MTVARFAVSFDPELARAMRRAAGDEPTSAWLADAARRKLRAQGLLGVVQDWEAEHGLITDDELRAAAQKGRPKPIRQATRKRRRA
jgi:hypothetical protein